VSHSPQDAAVARDIRRALEDVGVMAWLPQYSIEAGKMVDERIRRDIANCAFFMPIVSWPMQNAQEAFRREWEWAADRALGMPQGLPFILPVVLDQMDMERAEVPDVFKLVQPMRISGGQFPPEAASRIRTLIRDYRRRQ